MFSFDVVVWCFYSITLLKNYVFAMCAYLSKKVKVKVRSNVDTVHRIGRSPLLVGFAPKSPPQVTITIHKLNMFSTCGVNQSIILYEKKGLNEALLLVSLFFEFMKYILRYQAIIAFPPKNNKKRVKIELSPVITPTPTQHQHQHHFSHSFPISFSSFLTCFLPSSFQYQH